MDKIRIWRQKKYWIVAGVTGLLSLCCVIGLLLPKRVYEWEGSREFPVGAAIADSVIYSHIALRPGVYTVQLDYETDVDAGNFCTVVDGTVYPGGLLTNGTSLFAGLGRTNFQIWLFEPADNLQVCVDYAGQGSLRTGNLAICETGQLWSMLLAIVLCAGILGLVILYVWEYDRIYGIPKEKKTVFFWGAVIALLASLPYLEGNHFWGIDWPYHLQRIEGVKDGILGGQFPVRISPEWVYGYGYADGVMYCNALLLFPAVLRLLGFTVLTSYLLYGIVLNIATVWISYYCFSKMFGNLYIGLACSALYTLSIFRIYKLVITSAVGEGSAVTFMPLVLYGYFRVFTENPKEKSFRTAWIPLAFGYAGLVQTHMLTCEITVFLTVLVCLVLIRKIMCREIFLELCKGAAVAVALSLWFIVPFLDYYLRENLLVRNWAGRKIQSVGLYPAQLAFHFWKIGNNSVGNYRGMQYSYPMGIGLVLVVGFAVFSILWLSGQWRGKGPIGSVGKVSAVLGGLLMLMSLEAFPWDRIQALGGAMETLVGSLEFPHRFLGWGTVFLVCVCGCCLWLGAEQGNRWGYYIGVVTVLVGITTSSMYLLDFVGESSAKIQVYNREGMGTAGVSDGEYFVEGTDLGRITYRPPSMNPETSLLTYKKQYLHVSMTCYNAGEGEGYVELPILYYTGYRAYAEQTGERLSVVKGDNNCLRVVIPPRFSGTVEVKFVPPIHWRFSEAVSYASWLGMAAMGFVFWRHRGAKRERGGIG